LLHLVSTAKGKELKKGPHAMTQGPSRASIAGSQDTSSLERTIRHSLFAELTWHDGESK